MHKFPLQAWNIHKRIGTQFSQSLHMSLAVILWKTSRHAYNLGEESPSSSHKTEQALARGEPNWMIAASAFPNSEYLPLNLDQYSEGYLESLRWIFNEHNDCSVTGNM